MTLPNLLSYRLVLGFSMLCCSVAALASESAKPTPIIESTTSQIMAIVAEAPGYFDSDPDRFYAEIGAVLDETIDWRGFAKGVMGQYASNERYRSLDNAGREA